MTSPIGTYSFLPWLRRGIANTITAAAGGAVRATVPVDLTLTGDKVGGGIPLTQDIHRDVELYGPGDIIGLDARAVVRTEPRPWITNFEPNYLAFIEFYDEDLPWRYTPAPPDGSRRLTPWVALVVLSEDEFDDDGTSAPGKPLPFVTAHDASTFPAADELWAWAHVHVNRDLSGNGTISDDMGAVLGKFDAVMGENADLGCARLLCPRHLAPNTAYHAFVVPAFETGRLAGLGLAPAGAPSATASAWAAYGGREEPARYPYFYRWHFRTGTVGDFEYLVRLLQPRVVDPRVGQRPMDVQEPGADLPGITGVDLGGVLRLGGALRIPETNLDPAAKAENQKYEDWDQPYPHPFQVALAALVNLADDYLSGVSSDPDPVITPPLYGRWHALTNRLLEQYPTPPATNDNWVHELNLDPRFRVPAGFGTGVVQRNQEEYMAAAWTQIGAVLEANRRIRLAHLAREVGRSWHRRHLAPHLASDPGRVLALTAPVHRRVLADGVTVAHQVATSVVGSAPLSTAMRRITRPGARLVRSVGFDATNTPQRLVTRIALGEVTAARPKVPPRGIPTIDVVARRLARELRDARELLALIDDRYRKPDLVDALPLVPEFRLMPPSRETVPPKRGESDSPEGRRFKEATRDIAETITASTEAGREPERETIDVNRLATVVLDALHPDLTVPRHLLGGLTVPERLRPVVVEQFKEAMAFPEIDIPMYKPLVDQSSELFLPNLNLIQQNSITLLETNQRFIESYMVGLNHEMARELLWREYPTDQRGSYFRQFWDPSCQLSLPDETPDARRERLRDIPPLDHWSLGSTLGSHDNRELVPGTSEEELVLVIRGELLKRYPTAVIYAQRAKWKLVNGVIDPDAERELGDEVRTPLYEAKVDPDIYFFGFDITAEEARGNEATQEPGWFFVIRERPGEARFGFDIERTGDINVWNDLAWPDVIVGAEQFVPVGVGAHPHALTQPTDPDDAEKVPQWNDDKPLHWGADLNSSEIAYITYQAPMLVGVHAQEMLGNA